MNAELKNDGGLAFPSQVNHGADMGTPDYGMTIRDYFAAHAVAAFIAADGAQYFDKFNAHAKLAYAQADAMLEARSK